ncbi:uncharacterized protein LACBIDRAFT_304112 [Laccaria bicolor S238N-H82]|uniref:Predicted protein n=1 Tax=Laccaria bicolor (strain S238N-H82 / ATCC MYA-4686) TaxID=486041 RepID=B0DKZ2_LACBS|nr:uncharacterized protein LACBIDRAFT_304112 [Laccaria bicolor S238N-H82]EDR04821.1 predicted protein [Laccaria bicolor S238N-H82]|eukprot:XP_001884645.1 predicted protein [Laccaria bicolor S238N-H82]
MRDLLPIARAIIRARQMVRQRLIYETRRRRPRKRLRTLRRRSKTPLRISPFRKKLDTRSSTHSCTT